ncbi:MAG TPA: hypothetical protein VFV56_06915 [Gaiellaceae bacterium]|jgi:hypothetical protein|nr:hypothetical protein [Gaiellaceae bacterium]
MEIVLPRRYRGPLTSANGGYACGRLASFVDADEVEVTLRLPPPLDRPLRVEATDGHVRLLDGEAIVAEARPAPVDVDAPAPVPVDAAAEARERHVRDWSPDFRECYVCGIRDDGLEIRVGLVPGREPLHASPIALLEAGPEFVWAAIDCPGAYAVGAEGRGDIVLGRMTARVDRVPEAGEECVVTSWPLGEDGRKLHAGTALFSAAGDVLAVARQTWIVPKS